MTDLHAICRLTFQSEHLQRHSEDVTRLVQAAAHAGYALSAQDAAAIWETYSEDYAAGWISMGNLPDTVLVGILTRYGTVQRPGGPPSGAFIWGAPECEGVC